MNTYQQVIILSGELAGKTHESNRQRSENLEGCLQELGISYRQALGVYKDVQELSFVTLPKNEAEIDTLKNFAFENFGQESVLYQDGNGQAWLLYNDGIEENIGRLKRVSPKLVDTLENYTVMGGEIYTTEGV